MHTDTYTPKDEKRRERKKSKTERKRMKERGKHTPTQNTHTNLTQKTHTTKPMYKTHEID